uniref:Uncharacterized protein n=1 Tax=Arundo donax TaxID=35708 RepID=A0A0A9C5Q5_ARUDO
MGLASTKGTIQGILLISAGVQEPSYMHQFRKAPYKH